MPWQEVNVMTLRREFVELAAQEGANVSELCRRYEISRKTGYKWLGRGGGGSGRPAALQDRSRRPLHCPHQTEAALEQEVVKLRLRHPCWGGRKIAWRLGELGQAPLTPSTVTRILHRHGLIEPEASERAAPVKRFEHERPNAMWQMDFKGTFQTLAGSCLPLTVLDDHSRFNLVLNANARTDTASVKPLLVQAFERYGLPVRINTDNGPPWGAPSAVEAGLTELTIWMIRLGILVSHSRPAHPQTNGKIERFHQTLKKEVLAARHFADHAQVQRSFDTWRTTYNCERPHEALGGRTPAQRFTPSPWHLPACLPEIHYPATDTVLIVGCNGVIRFQGRRLQVCRALRRLPIGLRPDPNVDGRFDAYFCHHKFMSLDLASNTVQT